MFHHVIFVTFSFLEVSENTPKCPEKPMNKGFFGHYSTNVPFESSFVLPSLQPFILLLQPKK